MPAIAQQAQETQEVQEVPSGPPETRCACSLEISYADPERYRYWKRSRVHADMVVALAAVSDVYRAGRLDEAAICEEVRVPRKGEPFRTVDLCLHLDEWLQRVRDEGRCSIAPAGTEAVAAATCRLPRLNRGGEDFVSAAGRGADEREALCDAFAGVTELRLIAELEALEGDSLHGLPDIQHSHACRPL